MSTALAPLRRGALEMEKVRNFIARCLKVDEVKKVRDQAMAIKLYQRSRNASLETQNDAAEIAIRAERRLGELLVKTKKDAKSVRGRSTVGDTLSPTARLGDLGISKKQSSRWQAIAELPQEEFDDHIAAVRDRGEKLTTTGTLNAISQRAGYDGDEWGTPSEYIEAARSVMGAIDLDAASNKRAQKIVRARRFYTKEDDALTKLWKGRLWLNPPFSLAEAFTVKLLEEWEAGHIKIAHYLVNNVTDTAWFQDLLRRRFPVCFTKGRIPFLDGRGKPIEGTRQGQAIFLLGNRVSAFEKKYGPLGTIVEAI